MDRIGASSREDGFLEGPPPWIARVLASGALVLVAIGGLAVVALRFEQTVTAPFTITTPAPPDLLRSPRRGTVTDVGAGVGDHVEAGGVLWAISSEQGSDRRGRLDSLGAQRAGIDARRDVERARASAAIAVDREEEALGAARARHLDEAATLARQRVEAARVTLAQHRTLADAGLEAPAVLARHQLEVTDALLALERLRAEQLDARAAAARARAAAELHRSEQRSREALLDDEARRIEPEIAALSGAHASSPSGVSGEVVVRAPCAGHVLMAAVRGHGTWVEEGDVLGQLSCDATPLRVEIELSGSVVARVAPGQTARLMVDSLPHLRHGTALARLTWVSSAASADRAAGSYLALAELMEMEPRSAVLARSTVTTARLRPGMTGHARVLLGKRSLLDLVLDPLGTRDDVGPATERVAFATAGGTVNVDVEVADTPAAQERGLMYRAPLPPGRGMLFNLGSEQDATFWMKGTPSALDIVFVDSAGVVARVHPRATPHSEVPIRAGRPVRAVIELAGGQAAALGIREGDRVRCSVLPAS